MENKKGVRGEKDTKAKQSKEIGRWVTPSLYQRRRWEWLSVCEVREQDPVTVGLLSQTRSHHHVMLEAKRALIAGKNHICHSSIIIMNWTMANFHYRLSLQSICTPPRSSPTTLSI